LSPRIVTWWNSFNHDLDYNNFDECLEGVIYNYMEKRYFRRTGWVDSLKNGGLREI
jgi:hypothetical protein